ncbi:peptidyl-prolyl cis-trans isomerase CYP59-like [Vigna umbellata]|uniref:peptidyl-prolyl cis-trans isomerase CYP59-like n=1 Tax=Vigna umbellata TaxID=87088 RepID=UPI001F5E3986|nr:peptidyl-prolyl cis-trans isomerase CYP59-like [Vigna umbellata]
MDEQLNPAELEEVIRSKEAHSRAVVLESIGDIPDAEIKPPENVLFVCKLNPVTEDEDLNTIFSRFGTVSSAEIIRDHKTGDSLCYAFIGQYVHFVICVKFVLFNCVKVVFLIFFPISTPVAWFFPM